jgi:hypothetical protein
VLVARAAVEVEAGEEEALTLRPGETAAVEGVLIGEDGSPLAGVALEAQPVGGPGLYLRFEKTVTDDAGGFRFEGLPPGEVRIRHYVGGREIAVVAAPARDLRVALRSRSSVAFTLLGPDGERARGRTAVAWTTADGEGSGSAEVDGSDGSWVAEGLPAGDLLLRFASLEGGAAERRILLGAGESRDLGTLELRPWRRLRGRVVDGAGEPVAGAWVAVDDAVVSPDDEDAASDAEGFFEAVVDGDRPALLSLGADGFACREWRPPAEGADAGTIVLARKGVFDVRVRAPDGRPLLRTVEFLPSESADPEGDAWSDRTDDRGRVRMELPPGRWRIRVRGEGEGDPPRDLAEEDLPEGGTVSLDK